MFLESLAKFQSTLPTWGATLRTLLSILLFSVSIHAPHVGSDMRLSSSTELTASFNPRSPRGERHGRRQVHRKGHSVSIHAPHVGSDVHRKRAWCRGTGFNPRSPRGERPMSCGFEDTLVQFQSTLPTWGATLTTPFSTSSTWFQSTLPTWGATADSVQA